MRRPIPARSAPRTIAMIGTRGVPASYGGFETAVEEVGRRLVARGNEVVVYCRGTGPARPRTHLGMRLVHLSAVRHKALETLSHTALSAVHSAVRRPDVAFVFNAANSPLLPVLRSRRIPIALHMDGLEWRRGKWGPTGRRYYRKAEELGVRWADALIADAPGIAAYYDHQFGVPTELIRYGATILRTAGTEGITALGLEPGGYHLVVARFEPENHVAEIVHGYHASAAVKPLIIVGSAPYAAEYTRRVEDVARRDPRIRTLGGVWDQDLLDELYFHAFTYLHGHSVGGTNPSLLRAIGAGTPVIGYDVGFNREVVAGRGRFFRTAAEVGAAVEDAEARGDGTAAEGSWLREHAERTFDWDAVAADYDDLADRLAAGASMHPQGKAARRRAQAWRDL